MHGGGGIIRMEVVEVYEEDTGKCGTRVEPPASRTIPAAEHILTGPVWMPCDAGVKEEEEMSVSRVGDLPVTSTAASSECLPFSTLLKSSSSSHTFFIYLTL